MRETHPDAGHHIADGAIHAQAGPGQAIPATERDAVVITQLDGDAAEHVRSWVAESGRGRVGHQDAAFGALRVERPAQELVGQMVVIDNEGRRQARFRKLKGNEVFGAGGAARSIADVGRHRRACRDCVPNLLRCRACVANGSDYAQFGELLDIARSTGPVGRDRGQSHVTLRCVLQALKLGEVGRADPFARMRAARAVLG